MNKVERVRAAISGEMPDHIPFSFWTHMAGYDLDPEMLAQKTYEFYKQFDLDIIKTMDNGMYSVEDYGCKLDQSQVKSGGVTKLVEPLVKEPEDWKKIGLLDVEKGAYKRELDHLKKLVELVDGEAPIIFTVMSPMTTAEKLSGGAVIRHLLEGAEEAVVPALENITKSTCELAAKAIEIGAAGIFFASQIEYYDGKDDAFCLKYEKPYDLQVLEAAKDGWLNAIHAHGAEIMFDVLKDYPVQLFNWHVGESLPDIDEALDSVPGALMGGLDRMDIKNGKKTKIHNQIYRMIKQTSGKRMLLSPGCVVRLPLNVDALNYVRDTLRELEGSVIR